MHSMQGPLHDSCLHSGLIHTCTYCTEYINAPVRPHTHTHSQEAISFCVMIAHFRGRQQIQRCNGFVLIVRTDQYQTTLISHSQRKSPHLRMLVCHNTLSISYSPPYSPVSYSKLNSSHLKDCFTHGSIWVPFPSVCYLVSCCLPVWTQSVPVLISRRVITTTARARFPAPGAFIPLVCTAHEAPHICTPLPSLHPFNWLIQSLYRILACQSRGPVINSLITFLFLQTHFPHATPVSVTLHCN